MSDPLFIETVVLDGMWRVPDHARARDGRRYRIAWFDPPFHPPLEETSQALGICFTEDARIVLVTWNGGEETAGLILDRGLAVEESMRK
jgi:hypothetical protein